MEAKKRKNPPSKTARILSAGIVGIVWGGIGGAIIGASIDNPQLGAFLGAILIGPAEAITDALRPEGKSKPLIYRILMLSFLGAVIGAILGMLFKESSLMAFGIIIGLLSGIRGLRVNKTLIGGLIGGVMGLLANTYLPELQPAILGALVVFADRTLIEILAPDQEDIQIMAERVPKAEIKYVVPFEANSKYVGADYFKDLARSEEGVFIHNPSGVGIVESMKNMRGPYFNPNLVNPLIREFYKHTSNFKLDIEPVWNPRYKPLFWIYKRYIAQPIGQANLPFNTKEAQQGVVSYIDTIDFECDDIIDLRGWVRAFEQTGEAIYVGIYTTFQHQDVGYVSVGFPLPGSNFTATLLPKNYHENNFLLTSRNTEYPFPGNYLTVSENEKLTVMRLTSFNEEIEVFVQDGQLYTDHRFYLAGLNFLTLYYTMTRI
jgi:hypothetical protein